MNKSIHQKVTVFQNVLIVGYKKMECREIAFYEAPYAQYENAYYFEYIEKRKRRKESIVDQGSIRTVILDGWGWPELPDRYDETGKAHHFFADQGWNDLFDRYLLDSQAEQKGSIILDLRSFSPKTTSYDDDDDNPFSEPNINNEIKLIEGSTNEIIQTQYERSPEARALCLSIHGYRCKVCDFDFQTVYGEIGKEFIHVHHIEPISTKNGEYEIDPQSDLIPVCPNCHAMIHRKTPPFTIEEIKRTIAEQ
jgi:predicted restriction endonuclease